MFPFRPLIAGLVLCLTLISSTWAGESLIIASGAGYKRLVNEACAAFTAQTGIQVQQVFGNMGQIVPQAKESGNFDFVLGDENHLKKTDLSFSGTYIIGKGKLVVAVAKGSKVSSLEQITDPLVTRVAMPDSKNRITSYNVCYTKLLREISGNDIGNFSIQTYVADQSYFKLYGFVITSYSIHYTKLYEFSTD